jgi:hypothetical protein
MRKLPVPARLTPVQSSLLVILLMQRTVLVYPAPKLSARLARRQAPSLFPRPVASLQLSPLLPCPSCSHPQCHHWQSAPALIESP